MKALFAAAALCAMTALPASALDLKALTDEEKADFGAAVREYLMAKPEVLVEAINAMEERRLSQELDNDKLLVANNQEELFNDGYSWVGGNPDGDLTLVEFMDYKCGYCRRVSPEVEAAMKADPNLRVVLKEFPILGEESRLASRFAVAAHQIAGDDAYKQVHDGLMEAQGAITLQSLTELSDGLGLDSKAIMDHMNSEEVNAVLRKNHQLAEKMGIMGTPTFIIGPEMLRGAPTSGVEAAVAEIRKAANG